jgi:ERF superfamily
MKSSENIDKLAPALFAVQKELKPIFKSSRVEFGQTKYNYATEEDWYKGTQGALAKHDLMLTTSVDRVEELPDVTTRNKSIEHRVRVHGSARLLHVSGQWIENSGVGEGQSGNDKAAYAAQTGLKKYLYALMFALPTTDDPECVPHDDVVAQKNEVSQEANRLNDAVSQLQQSTSYEVFVQVRDRFAAEAWSPEESKKLMDTAASKANGLAAKICEYIDKMDAAAALDDCEKTIQAADYYDPKHKQQILEAIERQREALACVGV